MKEYFLPKKIRSLGLEVMVRASFKGKGKWTRRFAVFLELFLIVVFKYVADLVRGQHIGFLFGIPLSEIFIYTAVFGMCFMGLEACLFIVYETWFWSSYEDYSEIRTLSEEEIWKLSLAKIRRVERQNPVEIQRKRLLQVKEVRKE